LNYMNCSKIIKALFLVPIPVVLMILGFSATADVLAQKPNKTNTTMAARGHIMLLKDGALLVRLQTRSKSIEGLIDRGMEDKAKELEERQREENLAYVEAFGLEFDFAPVYFFRSEDSKSVKEERLDEVVFLTSELVPDSTIKVEQEIIYTAEFGNVEPDDSKRRQDYRLEKGSTGVKQKSTYYGSTNMGFEALVIMDDQFVQLRRPFPYYVRTYDKKGLFSRKPKDTVRRMNEKLYQFY
jgi:hypothetical protein